MTGPSAAEVQVAALLDAIDLGDLDAVSAAWKTFLDQEHAMDGIRLLRSALVHIVALVVPEDMGDDKLEELAEAIWEGSTQREKFTSDCYLATLLLARGDREVTTWMHQAVTSSQGKVAGALLAFWSAEVVAALTRHAGVDRGWFLASVASLSE